MIFKQLKYLIYSDLYRYYGRANLRLLLVQIFFGTSFKVIFWARTCKYLREKPKLFRPMFQMAYHLFLLRYNIKYSIQLPYSTNIGPGFFIGHYGGTMIHPRMTIGKNCNVGTYVVIGEDGRGERRGFPTIGNNVYIGNGAKIFGKIHIADNVAIGANCVVTRDVPENSVVVGVPGRAISNKGSAGYINKTDYEGKF